MLYLKMERTYTTGSVNWEDRWVKMSRIKELLQISDAEVSAVRELYNKTQEDINEDVNLLLNWLEKQPHLPQPHDKVRLECILLRNKFRIEQTKSKLDHYYTFKTLYPEFYGLNPESAWLQNVRKSLTIAPMPKLLPGLERLYCCRFVKDEEDNFNVLDKFQYFIMYWELQLSYDYNISEVHIWDFKYFTFKHVVKFDINLLQRGVSILRQALSGRFSRIYHINVPPSFDIVINILRRVMDSKLFAKIQVDRNMDSLHEAIPKEYLPEEFGGKAGLLTKLSDEWYEELKLQKDFLEASSKNCSDETLRIGKSIQNDLFGVDGTFRKINLD